MNALVYNTMIWIATCFFGPLIAVLVDRWLGWGIAWDREIGPVVFVLFGFIFGSLFSLPALVFASLSTHFLQAKFENVKKIKAIQAVISVLLMYVSLLIALGTSEKGFFFLLLASYSIAIGIASFITPLHND
jgi:hypothetical protein